MPRFAQQQRQQNNSHVVGPAKPDAALLRPTKTRNPFLNRQQIFGNQVVQRLAQSYPVFPGLSPHGRACHNCPPEVQAKLTLNQSGDKYEQEADRIADQVMRMPEPMAPRNKITAAQSQDTRIVQTQCPAGQDKLGCQQENMGEDDPLATKILADQITPLMQRQEEAEEDEKQELSGQTDLASDTQVREEEQEEEEPIQTKATSGRAPTVPPALHTQINGLRGKGQLLPESTRVFMERRFSYDFSRLRVHTDARAGETARAVNARAFTVGKDLVFGAGQFAPGTQKGRRLLAHELVHAVQQRGAARLLQRSVNAQVTSAFQPNPKVCFVHLHADEKNALAAAKDTRKRYRANLVHVQNPRDHRCAEVAGLSGGKACMVDPNRIFSSEDITRDCAFSTCDCSRLPAPLKGACSCKKSERKEAAGKLHRSFRPDLIEAINKCRGGGGRNSLDTNSTLLPVIAFHNTTNFSIREYGLRGSEKWAAATVKEIRDLAKTEGIKLPRRIQNPMGTKSKSKQRRLKKEYYRNFFVTTRLKDFLELGVTGHNVVLQSPGIKKRKGKQKKCNKDDGSLSIALQNARYINIEVAGKSPDKNIIRFNIRMAEVALHYSLGFPIPTRGTSVDQDLKKKVTSLTDDEKVYFFSGQPESLKPLRTTSGRPKDTSAVDNVLKGIKAQISRQFQRLASKGNRVRNKQPKARKMAEIRKSGTPHRTAKKQSRLYLGKFEPFPDTAAKYRSRFVRKWKKKAGEWKTRIKKVINALGLVINLIIVPFRGSAAKRQPTFAGKWKTRAGTVINFIDSMTDSLIHGLVNWMADIIIRAKIKEAAIKRLRTSTVPGLSRHHWGTDIDITSVTEDDWNKKEEFKRLSKWLEYHGPHFGFYRPFTAGRTKGHKSEPWHYSYLPISKPLLGIWLALHKKGTKTAKAGIPKSFNERIAKVALAEFKGKEKWRKVTPYAEQVFKTIDYTEFIEEIAPDLKPGTVVSPRPSQSKTP